MFLPLFYVQTLSLIDINICIESENKNSLNPSPNLQINRDKAINNFQNNLNFFKINQKIYCFTGNRYCSQISSFKDLKSISLKNMLIPFVHKGYYLKCRTIISSFQYIGIHILIEDTNGDIENLVLYNFQNNFIENPNDLIPEGTILLIKEPYLKYEYGFTTLHISSPSDVVFIDETDFENVKETN
jgi:hypothetical protein